MKYDPILCMMVDNSVRTKDESYIVRGRKYKVLKREGDNVTVKGPDGKVTNMHIDFLMSEGKKVSDKKMIDKAIRSADEVSEIRKAIGLLKNAMSVLGPSSETQQIVRDIQNVIYKLENID